MSRLDLDVGFYDPLSAFKGGFQSDFISRTEIPQITLKTPFDKEPLQMKNIHLRYIEELPAAHENLTPYLKFMFIVAPNVDDYRSTARPLIKQWIQKVKGLEPSIPLFIILFESTELKYATDKLLKTSIESKLKKDFPISDFPNLNIFRIKSIYSTNDEKLALWTTLKEKLKTSLSQSIFNKLKYYSNDETHKARIFNELKMYQQASLCYEAMFNRIDYIKNEDGLDSFKMSSLKAFFREDTTLNEPPSRLNEKLYYFKHLVSILVNSKSILGQKNEKILKLVDLLMKFINSIELTDKRHEFSYLLISEVLNLDYVKPFLETTNAVNNESFNSASSQVIKLLLLQRNELLKLGASKGYQLKGAFIDIAQNENDKLYVIETEKLQSILSNSDIFFKEILARSKAIISKLKATDTNKHTIATLEAEVALILHFNSKSFSNYSDDETLSYLYNAYQHFSKNKWDGISLSLLDVYIKHLEIKLNHPNLLKKDKLSTTLSLFESYLTLISLHPSVFKQNILEKYMALYFEHLECKTESDDLLLEVPNLLGLSKVSSLYCSKVDLYALDVILETPIKGMLIENIILELTSATESDTVIYFEWNNDLSNELDADVTYTTTNSVFAEGSYNVSKVFATIGSSNNRRVSITHTYDPESSEKISIFQIPVFKSKDQVKKNTIATVRLPSSRWLHKDALEFAVTIGDIDYKSNEGIFTFFKIEPDRIVADPTYSLTLDDKEIDNFEVSDFEDKIVFTTKDLIMKKGTNIILSMPFFFPAEITNTKINLQYSFEYKPEQANSPAVIQYHTDFLSTHLNIAASVDERIQHNALFCYFTLNSVSSKLPLCIQTVSLDAKRSDIKNWKVPEDVIVFMDQGSSFFFCINELKDKEVKLKIEYSSLLQEMIEFAQITFEQRLLESEVDSDLIKYSSIVRRVWSDCEFKTNYYALTGNIMPHEFSIADDSSILSIVPAIDRKRLVGQITKHADCLFGLSQSGKEEDFKKIRTSGKQVLWIPVKLPNIDIIATAEYSYQKSLQYLVGEPIEITIDLTVNSFEGGRAYYGINKEKNMEIERKVRFDDTSSLKSENTGNNVVLALDFLDDSQSWLISGILELNVEIDPYTTYTKKHIFKLFFIPLKSGKTELPALTTKLPNGSKFDLHLDFKNRSEVLTVVNQLNTVTQIH